MPQYTKLTDCKLFREGDSFEIWYMRPEHFSDFIMGNGSALDTDNLEKTHICLGQASTAEVFIAPKAEYNWAEAKKVVLNHLYHILQGEMWSPHGEANTFIDDKGLCHTSMSVGDMVRFKDGSVWMCRDVGWFSVKDKN